jgi:hypothetical protein
VPTNLPTAKGATAVGCSVPSSGASWRVGRVSPLRCATIDTHHIQSHRESDGCHPLSDGGANPYDVPDHCSDGKFGTGFQPLR